MSVCDNYILYVCPDPICDYWDIFPGICKSELEHRDNEEQFLYPPNLIELTVYPSQKDIADDRALARQALQRMGYA